MFGRLGSTPLNRCRVRSALASERVSSGAMVVVMMVVMVVVMVVVSTCVSLACIRLLITGRGHARLVALVGVPVGLAVAVMNAVLTLRLASSARARVCDGRC